MVKTAFLCGGSALAVAASLYGTQATAATANAAAEAQGTATVGELVVVAQKREQKIESVPVAITAFSAKQRDILGIRTVQELSDFTPGLSYYAIADRAYIRGIGRNTVNLATAAGVAVYYNGIYYGANGSISLQHDSLFIGNIEVDRGPQNTLHGSNADGGVINYISKRPTDTLTTELRGGVGNYDYYWGEGVISGPLNDNWKFRLGGYAAQQNGGYFRNLIGPPEGGSGPQGNGGKWWYEEGQLEGRIGDHLDVWAMASSGEFVTNFHTVATQGAIPETPFLTNGAGVLTPNTFYGLCAINAATHPECGPTGVPGSVIPGSAIAAGPVLASQFPGNNPSTANPHDFIETSTQHNSENDNVALATIWTYHLPSLDIQYLGGYQQFYYHLFFGPGVDSGLASFKEVGAFGQPVTIFPSGEGTLFDERDKNFSNEINLISTNPGPFQYLLGAYWFHEHFSQPIGAACFPNQPEFFHPVNGPANPDGCAFNQNGVITYNDYAGFGHFSYKFNEQWELAGGIRYTTDHRAGSEFVRDIAFCGGVFGCGAAFGPFPIGDVGFDVTAGAHPLIIGPGALPPPQGAGPAHIDAQGFLTRALSASWSGVTGDATVNWTPDSTTLAYFRYARGYKAGGFAAGTFQGNSATGTPAFTNPETLDSYEVGFKKTWGSTLLFNGDVFYYNWTNDQQPLTVSQSGVLVSSLFNIPSVREYGVEIEAMWRPIDPLTFNLSYAYLNTRVMSHLCVVNADDPGAVLPGDNVAGCGLPLPAGQPINLQGSELPEAPPNKVSLNGQYVFTFDPGKLTLSASLIWKDKTYGSIFNNPLNLAPAYYTLNLRAVWDDAKDRYSIIGYINNVTNTIGYDNVTQTTLFPTFPLVRATGITAPLTFGAEVQFRFR